ncbi:hypothetical protein HanIR_Chr01g0003611 [Helianthus annuus]|nr:hypothetical protein HanIR_Chr01g0003611 [Helianthus annuus]KAJ0625561.1 hypothetical protein HanHA89_Chr01g0003001 [Helianthus annuus]
MIDFPSCFGENGVQIADASSSSGTNLLTQTTTPSKNTQNLVTCVYHCKLHSSSCFIITITWTKTLMGQSLFVQINDPTNNSFSKHEIKSNLFSKRKGSKTLQTGPISTDILWDLSSAKYGSSSPEPIEGFYLAVTINQELLLVLGDMDQEVYKKMNCSITCSPNSVFVSKTEHVFGKKVYATSAQFCGKGQVHEILIECDQVGSDDPFLSIRIDGKMVMQVKRLQWKFRGNYTVLVDGLPVEVYWDVYSWFFGKVMGNAVFLFQTCLSAERLWGSGQPAMSWSGPVGKDVGQSGLGFSLVVFAWKNE